MSETIERAFLDGIAWGWLVVDRDRRVLAAGPRAVGLLDVADGIPGPGTPLHAVVPRVPLESIGKQLAGVLDAGSGGGAVVVTVGAGAEPSAAVRVHVFPIEHGDGVAAGLAVEPLPAIVDETRPEVALAQCLAIVSRVRHEVNNALMGIYGNAELLIENPELPAPLRARAQALLDDARKVRELVRELSGLRRGDA